MEDSYKAALREIKKNIDKAQKASDFKFLFFVILGAAAFALAVIYIVLKFRDPEGSYEIYEEFYDDDDDVYPFDEDEAEDDEE